MSKSNRKQQPAQPCGPRSGIQSMRTFYQSLEPGQWLLAFCEDTADESSEQQYSLVDEILSAVPQGEASWDNLFIVCASKSRDRAIVVPLDRADPRAIVVPLDRAEPHARVFRHISSFGCKCEFDLIDRFAGSEAGNA